MKLIRSALALLLAAALLTVPAWAIDLEPGTGAEFYVRDTADVLSADTESTVAAYNAVLENACDGAQLVVVTVPYLDEDADIAATKLMNDWGVGSSSQSNGMLLLLVTNERRGWLALGAGIDDDFTQDMAEEYLEDYFWPDVDRDRFDDAVQSLTSHLYDAYLELYGVQDYQGYQDYQSGYYPAPDPQPAPSRGSGFALAILVVILLVILRLVMSAGRYSRMRTGGYRGSFFPLLWFGGSSLYRNWRRQRQPPPPPPPGPGGPAGFGGPGGFMGGGFPSPRQGPSFSRPSRPRGSGFGGRPGGGAGRPSGGFRSGGFRGSGGGGHAGGRGAGRR